MSKIKVEVDNKIKEYENGTTLLEISKDFQDSYEEDIILARNGNKLIELFKTITCDCKIDFITTKENIGHKTYFRGIILVMLKAFYDIIPNNKIEKILVEYSLGNGYYCEVIGDILLNKEILNKVNNRMKQIVEDDIPFTKRTLNTDDAIDLFKHYKMYDKEKLFNYRRVSKVNLYKLGEFEDYFYGYMPPSSGVLKYFDLILYEDGFILNIPSKKNPRVLEDVKPLKKLYYTLKEASNWGKMVEIETVGDLNDVISHGKVNDLILVQEALQEKKIGNIAEQIREFKNSKFVMIAGPSSSGKTTFSHRLSIQLKTLGLKPHLISLDDYFIDRELNPKDEFGNYDFECLEAIDIDLFNRDMTSLLDGKVVEIPTFNFKTGKREYRGNIKKLGDNDILIIEGIHGLNDKLSYTLPRESKFKIYISALTQLNIDEHNRIPTTDGRLIRRMVRDNMSRGSSAQNTISMWNSVRKGEENNIFPFQEEADVMFNSALIYELSILKQYAELILFGIDKESKEYIEAKRLLKFLDYFIGVSSEGVPKNSILREFIGGSCFKV